MKIKSVIASIIILLSLASLINPFSADADEQVVYVVPIKETVEKGLLAFLERAVEEAEEAGAEAIIFDVHTPGGVVDAADGIGKLLTGTDLKTVAFVNKKALSAGAYISLNTDEIYMVPGATMGSAAIIDQQGNTAGKKAESYWFAAMKAAAVESGRDPIYAQAMADDSIDLPELGAGKGKLLTLTANQALEVGYSEGTAKNLNEVLEKLGLENAEIRNVNETFAEKLARFITHPVVIPILMTIGSLGLVLELYSPGFGLPGIAGLSSLLLFFYGHMVAGLAGFETLILFALGVGLILLELFIPGGIAGAIGLLAIFASFFMASDNVVHMGISLLIALTASIVLSILMIRVFGKKMKFFRRIILTDSTSTEKGYVSNKNRLELIGVEGITLTPLRPSGTIVVEDERIDAVSEGGFIAKDKKVRIVKTEGSRIVVREVTEI